MQISPGMNQIIIIFLHAKNAQRKKNVSLELLNNCWSLQNSRSTSDFQCFWTHLFIHLIIIIHNWQAAVSGRLSCEVIIFILRGIMMNFALSIYWSRIIECIGRDAALLLLLLPISSVFYAAPTIDSDAYQQKDKKQTHRSSCCQYSHFRWVADE